MIGKVAAQRLRILTVSALIVLVFGVALWGKLGPRPLSPEEREVAAQELVSGIQVSTKVSGSSLVATKALVDFLTADDVRLVLVRIVDGIDLEIRVETDHAVAFSEPPRFCLIGPFSAPDDGGFSSPCWGAPEIGELLAAQLPADGAGHAMFPAGRVIMLSATIRRVDRRCDYPAGRWALQVEANPLVDGTPMGVRQLAEIGFDVPYAGTGPLAFLPVSTTRYCGLANVVYKVQGEPELASPSP